jgi:hypothetical protein
MVINQARKEDQDLDKDNTGTFTTQLVSAYQLNLKNTVNTAELNTAQPSFGPNCAKKTGSVPEKDQTNALSMVVHSHKCSLTKLLNNRQGALQQVDSNNNESTTFNASVVSKLHPTLHVAQDRETPNNQLEEQQHQY